MCVCVCAHACVVLYLLTDVSVCLFVFSTLSRLSKTTTAGTSEAAPASEVRVLLLFSKMFPFFWFCLSDVFK